MTGNNYRQTKKKSFQWVKVGNEAVDGISGVLQLFLQIKMRSRLKRVLCYFLICTGCSSLFFLGISQDSYDSNVSSAYGGNPANFTFEIVKTLKHLGTGRHVEFLQIPKVKCGLSQELLILVKSTADAFDKREIQRQTWVGEVKHLGIPVVFALGRSLNLTVNQIVSVENRRFGDLLQADFTDKYANLSLKTLATFLWEADCRPAKRLFHTDDDCILLTQNFISFFNRSQADLQSETILGHCWNRSKVVRDPNNTKR